MKTFIAGNIEVMGNDFKGSRGYSPSPQVLSNSEDDFEFGWRLPALNELLYLLSLNNIKIGGFTNNNYYCEKIEGGYLSVYFPSGEIQELRSVYDEARMRLVRSI